MSKVDFYIEKRAGWDHYLNDSLELMDRNGEPITIRFLQSYDGCEYTIDIVER